MKKVPVQRLGLKRSARPPSWGKGRIQGWTSVALRVPFATERCAPANAAGAEGLGKTSHTIHWFADVLTLMSWGRLEHSAWREEALLDHSQSIARARYQNGGKIVKLIFVNPQYRRVIGV